MYGIINCLYSEKNQQAFEKLYLDSEPKEQMILRSTIAEAFKDCPRILESNGADWVLCTLASYHKSEDDTMRVYSGIMRHLKNFSIGLLTDDIKWKEINEIADCCLVGVSFFRKNLESKYQHKASPSPDYYSNAGAMAFSRLGFEDISSDFKGWTSFISKEMTND
jgi:hypothetical protein